MVKSRLLNKQKNSEEHKIHDIYVDNYRTAYSKSWVSHFLPQNIISKSFLCLCLFIVVQKLEAFKVINRRILLGIGTNKLGDLRPDQVVSWRRRRQEVWRQCRRFGANIIGRCLAWVQQLPDTVSWPVVYGWLVTLIQSGYNSDSQLAAVCHWGCVILYVSNILLYIEIWNGRWYFHCLTLLGVIYTATSLNSLEDAIYIILMLRIIA